MQLDRIRPECECYLHDFGDVINNTKAETEAGPERIIRVRSRMNNLLLRTGSRTLLLGALLPLFLGSTIWMLRVSLLREIAQAWITSDPVTPADAVAVLGGGLETRPLAAATYYHQGIVQKVLISDAPMNRAEGGVSPSHTALNRAALLELGVPEAAIETFGYELPNTFAESLALRDWAERNRAAKIIVPTEIFSSRRVKWVMQHTFAGTGVRIQVPALTSPEYHIEKWWLREKVRTAFEDEVIKYVYYRFKYGPF